MRGTTVSRGHGADATAAGTEATSEAAVNEDSVIGVRRVPGGAEAEHFAEDNGREGGKIVEVFLAVHDEGESNADLAGECGLSQREARIGVAASEPEPYATVVPIVVPKNAHFFCREAKRQFGRSVVEFEPPLESCRRVGNGVAKAGGES